MIACLHGRRVCGIGSRRAEYGRGGDGRALSTMTTVGYGDVVPESVIEKIVSMLAMLAGATVFAYLSGAMSTMLSALNVEDARIAEKRQAVEDFVKERNLPPLLGARLRKYYQYVMQHSIYSEEMSIIQGLSASLRTEVVLFLYRGALEKVPFFKGKHPQFIVQLVSHLKMEFYSPGDIVALQGDAGPEMYFVSSGNLEVRLYPHLDGMTGLGTGKRTIPARSNLKPSLQQQQDVYRGRVRDKEQDRPPWEWIRRLARRVAQWRTGASPAPSPQKPDGAGGLMSMLKWSKPEAPSTRLPPNYRVLSLLGVGQYFGEYSCLTGDKRLATVVALDFCELYRLTRSDLNDVIKDWPNIGNELANLRGTMKTSMMTVEEQLRILKIMGYKRTNSGYVANLQNASKASARQSDADLMSSGAMMPANSEEAKMGAMPPSLPPLSIRKSSLVGSASPDSAGGEDDRQELPRIAPRKAGREAMQPLSMDAPVQQPQLPSAASSTTSDTSDTDGSASRTSHALAAAV